MGGKLERKIKANLGRKCIDSNICSKTAEAEFTYSSLAYNSITEKAGEGQGTADEESEQFHTSNDRNFQIIKKQNWNVLHHEKAKSKETL